MNRRLLPIGIQDFRTMREDDCYYVDKTPLIRQLVSQGRHYFLSRPRRFGKSLLLDTLKELFEGNEPLFRGLDIHGRWDWSKTHPVVRLSFGGKYNEPGDLKGSILAQLAIIERNAGLDPPPGGLDGPERFRDLLDRLHRKTGRPAAVFVDEYDKPILDALGDPALARANRDHLRGFYGIVKDSAEHVRFTFVTGITMFSKVSLFSGLNNLKDISLDPRYATLCGYTETDLDTVFAPELPGLDRNAIRAWYNGYHWGGREKVYNPFDVLLLFDARKFKSWWFETGTPDFLYRLIVERGEGPLELEGRPIAERRLSRFDVDDIDLRALMFQAGYLTIAGEDRRNAETFYTLEFPNQEVRRSFNLDLLAHLGQDEDETTRQGHGLLALLTSNDFDGFAARLRSWLAGIPHQWFDAGNLGRYESHFAAMLYMTFCAVGADVRAEESSSRGRADMVLLHGGQVFVLEFKMAGDGEGKDADAGVETVGTETVGTEAVGVDADGVDAAGIAADGVEAAGIDAAGVQATALARAIQQMRDRGYAEKYRVGGGPVHLIGMVFGQRKLLATRAERL